ncbi:hypothetical protein MKW92_043076 [Papaver armeniacum]|nr:hypothetical protein MKW92_043076 [Papaver armeniacum]
MEEDTQAIKVTTVVDDTKSVKVEGDETEIITNGDLLKKETEGNKEQEEETSLEGEFIKVEKESYDLRDASPAADQVSETVHEHKRPSFFPRSTNISDESREMIVELEKIKELELELKKMAGDLKHSESENADLKEEILVTKDMLQKRGKQCEELELDQKKIAGTNH